SGDVGHRRVAHELAESRGERGPRIPDLLGESLDRPALAGPPVNEMNRGRDVRISERARLRGLGRAVLDELDPDGLREHQIRESPEDGLCTRRARPCRVAGELERRRDPWSWSVCAAADPDEGW